MTHPLWFLDTLPSFILLCALLIVAAHLLLWLAAFLFDPNSH
jgi:hypothetical protein